jgi:hypothetical protein
MDDIEDISPDDAWDFKSILDPIAKANAEIAHYWIEDDFEPFTPYIQEQERIKYIRFWYARHLAPRV